MEENFPQPVRACLWSYDTTALDTERHKRLIIRNVLNYGTEDAVTWLKQTYSIEELREAVRTSLTSAWSPKSLNYWSIMLDVAPERASRL